MKTKTIYLILIVIGILLVSPPNMDAVRASPWTEPEMLSDWRNGLSTPWLVVGKDGTQAIFWTHYDYANTSEALWGRVRPPGGEWSTAQNIFGWRDFSAVFPQYGITTSGKVWAVTVMPDKNQPGDNMQVKAAGWLNIDKWEIDVLSDYESDVRDIDLSTGPEGHLAITWVACTASASQDQGPCDVRLRRRKPEAIQWEPRDDSIDAAVTGVIDARSLVGDEGLVVTTWGEYSQTAANEWLVMSSAFDPASKTWDSPPLDISNGGFIPGQDPFLAEPVMGYDGTVIAGWYGWSDSHPTKSILSVVTRQGGTGKWSLPVPLSGYHFPSGSNSLRFSIGKDGTALAAWVERRGSISEHAIYANQRDPGSVWLTNPIKVTNWIDQIVLAKPQALTDGSGLLLWKAVDNRRPVSESQSVFWSARSPKGDWGDLGDGQLGGWFREVFSVSLVSAQDGSVTAVWSISDSTRLADQYAGVLAASWKPSRGEIPASTLTSGYHSIYLNEEGVAVSLDGSSRAAAWVARKYINNPNPTAVDGVFYTQWFNGAYLPVVVK